MDKKLENAIDEKFRVNIGSDMIDHIGNKFNAATVWNEPNFMKSVAFYWNHEVKHPVVSTQFVFQIKPDKKVVPESISVLVTLEGGVLSYSVQQGATPSIPTGGIFFGGEPTNWMKAFKGGDLKPLKMDLAGGPIDKLLNEVVPAVRLFFLCAMNVAHDFHYIDPKEIYKKAIKSIS